MAEAPISSRLPHMQVLGACARRGYQDNWLRKGDMLDLREKGGLIQVVHGEGRVIGFLQNDCRKHFMRDGRLSLPKVAVVSDVNLNDKYGQCFVVALP